VTVKVHINGFPLLLYLAYPLIQNLLVGRINRFYNPFPYSHNEFTNPTIIPARHYYVPFQHLLFIPESKIALRTPSELFFFFSRSEGSAPGTIERGTMCAFLFLIS
jgi:hypothetical protein